MCCGRYYSGVRSGGYPRENSSRFQRKLRLSVTRLHKLGSSLRDLRTVVGMLPALLAVFNNAIFAIIPLTPLLRPRATFLVILAALISFAMTHNYASNRIKKGPDVVGL